MTAAITTGEDQAIKPDPHLRATTPSIGERFRDLAWLCALVFQAVPRAASLWALAGFLRGVLTPLQVWAGGQLIGGIAAGADGQEAGSPWLWVSLIAMSLVGARFLDVARSYLEATVTERGVPAVQARVYAQVTAIDLSDFEHQSFYDATARITTEIETQAGAIMRELQGSFQSGPRLIGAVILVFGIDWRLGLIALLPLVPNMVMWFRSGDQMWTMLSDQTRDRRLAAYYADRLTDRQAAKEIRLFELQSHLIERWSQHYLATRDELRRKRMVLSMKTFSLIATTSAGTLAGLIWLVFGADVTLSPQEVTVLMSSFLSLPNWVFSFAEQAFTLGQFSGIASDTRALVERPAPFAGHDPSLGRFVTRLTPGQVHGSLEARDVRFTYPGSARSIIDGVSLVIPSGQRVAIVGENGAGKTTFLKLLLGLYRPDLGTVELDGTAHRDIPVAERQRRLSAVFQQFTRYPLTLEDNITLGSAPGSAPGSAMDNGDGTREGSTFERGIDDVLAMAGMDTLVGHLPDGAMTMLSPDLGGVDLSGGQWQRLAIARAGFRNADILALDEPTAALDPMAEVDIFRRFARLAEGRTTLLVSHRLGMARLADRIIVIEHGRVIEDGTHERLVAANGQYARMWRAQARWYAR